MFTFPEELVKEPLVAGEAIDIPQIMNIMFLLKSLEHMF